ncbi:MAG: photosynthetic reaction center cytochrome c subunit [Chitinophagaceae bacterium]|nr:photosynthetic reaction center cytochrome c subunit [Rubrivivax sp.]
MKTKNQATGWAGVALALIAALVLGGCEKPDSVQRGYRGTGMSQLYNPDTLSAAASLHAVPDPEPTDPPDPEAPAIKDVFKNVTVLNDLTVLEFSRLMQALSTWVAPVEGCEFCHNPNKLESDEKYAKVVARRMLQMTRQINTEWKSHVAGTGVTCWTCHRGQAVPSGDWFASPVEGNAFGMLGRRDGQNQAGVQTVGNASLPVDPLSKYLVDDSLIRVQGTSALADGTGNSVKSAEWTYALMIYMSKSLGVNCSFCHNTRALARWDESSPQRSTAWYGIRMVRSLNTEYLNPIKPLLPSHRLSAQGDGPKVGCETCHKGAYKPLYGAPMLADYPELAGVMKDRPPAVAAAPVAASAAKN